jgi:uncharacterized protein (TIRG00374 family)
MKLVINLVLSLGMLALCVWLIWPDHATRDQLSTALSDLTFRDFAPYLALYMALLIGSHIFRALRWRYLLAPIGVEVPTGPLLAISSVGFMAIAAFPARLGELVRPGLMRKRGVSASAALGTVAVERIVDGLLVSLFVFFAFLLVRSSHSPSWMMPTAYAALGIFTLAMVFLVGALKWPDKSIKFWLSLSLLPRFAPRIANVIERKAREMIRGFEVMRDRKNLTLFTIWSLIYWVANGVSLYVLAQGFGLHLSLIGAFATMGLVSVGLTLPNSPGLVGQFQWFTLLGLSLYLGPDAATKHTALYAKSFALANVQYVLAIGWYVLAGVLGLATRWVSFHDMWQARKSEPTEREIAAPAPAPDVPSVSAAS